MRYARSGLGECSEFAARGIGAARSAALLAAAPQAAAGSPGSVRACFAGGSSAREGSATAESTTAAGSGDLRLPLCGASGAAPGGAGASLPAAGRAAAGAGGGAAAVGGPCAEAAQLAARCHTAARRSASGIDDVRMGGSCLWTGATSSSVTCCSTGDAVLGRGGAAPACASPSGLPRPPTGRGETSGVAALLPDRCGAVAGWVPGCCSACSACSARALAGCAPSTAALLAAPAAAGTAALPDRAGLAACAAACAPGGPAAAGAAGCGEAAAPNAAPDAARSRALPAPSDGTAAAGDACCWPWAAAAAGGCPPAGDCCADDASCCVRPCCSLRSSTCTR